LVRRLREKVVVEKLCLLRRRERSEIDPQPPHESLDKRLGVGAIEATGSGHDSLVWMRTADDQSLDPVWRILRHAPPDPPSHRVPPEVCRTNLEGVENRDDIPDLQR
jgi:hypothetical protein